jgi:hypothetical protein
LIDWMEFLSDQKRKIIYQNEYSISTVNPR